MPFAVKELGATIGTTPRPLSSGGDYRCSTPTTIIVWNVGSTSVWGRTDGGLATTAWPSREVPAGQPREFILTPENGDAILSLVAATSAVNVTLQVFTFRSPLVAELVMAAALMAVFFLQSFWEAVSGTVIRLTGSYVEAQFDTTRARTTNGNWRAASQGMGSIYLGDTTANPAANNDVLIGKATSWTAEIAATSLSWSDSATSGGRATWDPAGINIKAADPANNSSQDGGSYTSRAKNNVATVITNFDASIQQAVIAGGGAANPDVAMKHTVDGVEVFRVVKKNQDGFRGTRVVAAIDVTAVNPLNQVDGSMAYDSTYARYFGCNGIDWIMH